MNKPLIIVFIVIGILLFGGIFYSYIIAPSPLPENTQTQTNPNTTEEQLIAPEDLQRLAVDSHTANSENITARFLALFYMKGVDQPTKDALQKTITADFTYDFASIEVAEPGKNNVYEYVQDNVKYRANLPVTYKLVIHFKENKDNISSASFYVGENEGKYYLVTATPVGKQ